MQYVLYWCLLYRCNSAGTTITGCSDLYWFKLWLDISNLTISIIIISKQQIGREGTYLCSPYILSLFLLLFLGLEKEDEGKRMLSQNIKKWERLAHLWVCVCFPIVASPWWIVSSWWVSICHKLPQTPWPIFHKFNVVSFYFSGWITYFQTAATEGILYIIILCLSNLEMIGRTTITGKPLSIFTTASIFWLLLDNKAFFKAQECCYKQASLPIFLCTF